jgi:hypothetical protein
MLDGILGQYFDSGEGGDRMSLDEETKVLLEAASAVVAESPKTFKIVITDHVYAGSVLTKLLVRNKQVPKNSISQLGYTASNEQNAALLSKGNPIVIIAKDILKHRPATFFPPPDAETVAIIDATEGRLRVNHQTCVEGHFVIEKGSALSFKQYVIRQIKT